MDFIRFIRESPMSDAEAVLVDVAIADIAVAGSWHEAD